MGNAGMVVPSHVVPLAAPGMAQMGLKMMFNPQSPFYIEPRIDLELFGWAWRFYRAANASHVARSAPLLRDLHLASRSCYEELAAAPGGDFGLVKKGLLMLCKTERALAEEGSAAERASRLGIPAQVLDARATAALEPGVEMEIAGAVYYPKDCHLNPAGFLSFLAQQLRLAGAQFHYETEVAGWRAAEGRIEAVRTSRGELTADEYVLCGGSWSPEIVRELKLRIPIQAGKGYSVTLARPRQRPQICSIFVEARLAVTPMDGGLRFGGTMEIAGLDTSINDARVRGIVNSVPRYYPQFKVEDFANVPAWVGLRPCSPDGLPYLGRSGRFRNLSIATGHAMMGLSLGPITGKLMADILSDQTPSIDIGLLSPDRYASRL
jgi:D-amino-acid dehydrogenase